MRMRIGALAAAALLFAVTPAHGAEIGTIRAHLVYEETGRLSADILSQPDFAGWNSIIGEGSAEEYANDVLVLVEVVGGGGQENVDTPLEIVARDAEGSVRARRRFSDGLLTSDQGRVWKALWLPDSTCAGHIEITASLGQSTRRAAIDLDCGE